METVGEMKSGIESPFERSPTVSIERIKERLNELISALPESIQVCREMEIRGHTFETATEDERKIGALQLFLESLRSLEASLLQQLKEKVVTIETKKTLETLALCSHYVEMLLKEYEIISDMERSVHKGEMREMRGRLEDILNKKAINDA